MDMLANEETSGSEQYSSPMQDDYSEDEDSFAGIVLPYLYEPSESQASSNSSSREDSELSCYHNIIYRITKFQKFQNTHFSYPLI